MDILRNEITKLKIQDAKYQEEFKKFFDKLRKIIKVILDLKNNNKN